MSEENAKLFFEKVKKDKQLQKKLENLSDENREELVNKIIAVGTDYGYEFSRDDMKK